MNNKEQKEQILKTCVMAMGDNLTEEDWADELNDNPDLKELLNCVYMAMDLYYNKKAGKLLEFVRKNYEPEENKWDWVDLNRNVVVNDDGVLISFELKQNIQAVLERTERESKHFEDDGAYAE